MPIQAYQTDPNDKFVVPQLMKILPKRAIKLETQKMGLFASP